MRILSAFFRRLARLPFQIVSRLAAEARAEEIARVPGRCVRIARDRTGNVRREPRKRRRRFPVYRCDSRLRLMIALAPKIPLEGRKVRPVFRALQAALEVQRRDGRPARRVLIAATKITSRLCVIGADGEALPTRGIRSLRPRLEWSAPKPMTSRDGASSTGMFEIQIRGEPLDP